MKKILSVLLAFVLSASVLATVAGCKKEQEREPDIVYAAWNLSTEAINNIERRMVKAFEQKTGYKVKIEDAISITAYEDSIKILASKDKMPDVFMLSNMHFGLTNEYVEDLTALTAQDDDWDNIPAAIRDAVYYGQGIYAVPFAINMMGYFLNLDLFEEENVQELDVSPDYEQFFAAINSFAAKKNKGLIGLTHENAIMEWYPASKNEDFGWFTWDGEKYNLDSSEFNEGVLKTKEIYEGKLSFDSLTETERSALFPGYDNYVDLWNAGKVAIRWGQTYEIPDMLEKGSFNVKFIGVPGGRAPIVGDYLGISPTCAKPQIAYEFAKWMSFDPEGIAKRMELDAQNKEFNTLPVTTDTATINAYFMKNNRVKGLRDAFLHIDDGIVEATKIVPGYVMSRWNAYTNVKISEEVTNANIGQLLDQCWRGTLTLGDYMPQLNELANKQYSNAVNGYKDKYK